MFDLSRHPYFEKYTDPVSGVESFILTKKVGGLQRHFYFAQRSVTDDGKYLWVMCANPPARYFTFAVVSLDPDDPFIRHFPHASPDSGLPCISPDGKGVYYCMGNALYSVDVQGEVKKILELPWEYIKGRRLEQMCTHVSVSCDGKYAYPEFLQMWNGFINQYEIEEVAKTKVEIQVAQIKGWGHFVPYLPN